MKNSIKQYFAYSKGELRGMYVLILLIIIVFAIPSISSFFSKGEVIDFSEFEAQISKVEANIQEKEPDSHKSYAIEYFNFDPNSVSREDLNKLGFSSKQAQTLLNYRASGGKFLIKDDLLKVYSIDTAMFEALEPYILIVEKKVSIKESQFEKNYEKNRKPTKSSNPEYYTIELNVADSVELMLLNGIGPILASRIIIYRDLLGGFYNPEQILEVYGVDSLLFQKIEHQLLVNPNQIKKINLNTIDFKELNQHPYFSYSDTKSIFKYKKLMGAIKSVDELEKNKLIDTQTYLKVLPYLDVE